jgi:BirA family transcriptional regulator, biotin operon repressor / biotin---[acetyl-CoA-carboxylase] ligase
MGRAWETVPGEALLTSWVLRCSSPAHNLQVLSPLMTLAVIRAVRRLAPTAPVGYKWPNDVLVDGRKLAGILLTSRMLGTETTVIAGIGVNVVPPARAHGDRASLGEWSRGVHTSETREGIAVELCRVWECFLAHGALTEPDRRELESCMAWRDEVVEVLTGERAFVGTVEGLAPDGAILMRCGDSDQPLSLRVGEISRGPRKVSENRADSYRILS